MRIAFVHDAVLELSDDAEAPGAAITTLLCGSWDNTGPCPLASHHTTASRSSPELRP